MSGSGIYVLLTGPHGLAVCLSAWWGGENKTGQVSWGQNLPGSEVYTVAVAVEEPLKVP